MNIEPSFRSAFIALVGRPNSGKSTLLNTIIGEQLSVVTPLPQTTRSNLRGIYTTEQMQLVFVDTPGIHTGKHAFNESMMKEARSIVAEKGIDCICYLVDLSREFGNEESVVAQLVSESGLDFIVVFNKVDAVETPDQIINQFYQSFPQFKDKPSVRISAISKESKDLFLKAIDPFVGEGPLFFDPEEVTDANLRFFAAEYIRKHIILNTREEVPHAVFVEIESYQETEERHRIDATIHVETVGQRGIIVGKGGTVITRIRKSAEKEMKELVQTPVSITCHIKVSPKWRDNESFLRLMGLPVR